MNKELRIAVPKGRLYDPTMSLLTRAEMYRGGDGRESRKLIFDGGPDGIEYIALKPIDIPVYVEAGAVDAGIVGTDILRELDSKVHEPLDLRIGRCTLVLAAPAGVTLEFDRGLRVATKYPKTAAYFFRARNTHVHVVRLDGSVEIAPRLGLADAIVDLVETGRTLRENGMVVVEEIATVTAKLIVNRTSMKVKSGLIGQCLSRLDAVVYANG
ncbi:MAG TPA: ATP phosphoribosyltransferase [Bacteroidota bacterium]|nr:ATP phosphoribosyltransferase [Bacteroidota bacterium]